MIISCANCSNDHATLLLYCPNCGNPLVNIGTDGDVVVFGARGGWRMSCLVSFDGNIQDKISGFVFSPQGLAVVNGSGQQRRIALLDLLKRLKQRIEVLEL